MRNPFHEFKQEKSYGDVAKEKGHTYFHMEDKVKKEALEKVNYNQDEMWRIRKLFLDEQTAQGKSFELVSDPCPQGEDYTGFYRREIAYLRSKGYKLIKKEDCWHAFR